ncbi:MAG: FtsQ-type POTRA domain-containing protein, partial [Clostridia bacterium]|nr:FtsQ-type POTRA domain-containing protein [Clostridia bacterium]MBO4884489.1 FtsQ-type POTRA domain-containing protein [Clostridia bacterium]
EAAAPARTAAGARKAPKARPGRQRRAGLRFLAMVGVLVVAALLIRSRVFVLGEVRVEGNEAYSDAQIAAMSGLRLGESIFSVNENAVARSFSTSSEVKLLDVRVELPDTVTLVVSERKACAAVNCAGVILIVDEEGHIMQRLSSVPESGVIVVSGLDVSVNAQGRQIESAKAWQLRDMRAVLTELEAMGMSSVISELNLADRYNIYLVSSTGVQIILGDEENLAGKLVWAQTILEKLTQEGIRRGVLDVSTGKNAVYADR